MKPSDELKKDIVELIRLHQKFINSGEYAEWVKFKYVLEEKYGSDSIINLKLKLADAVLAEET